MFVPRDGDVAGWQDQGARLFLQGSDHTSLGAGAKAARGRSGILERQDLLREQLLQDCFVFEAQGLNVSPAPIEGAHALRRADA
jgi:hypothetical protein